MEMDDRKRKVLAAIVRIYSDDGEPVGSNLLSQALDISVSPATLRNEMASLTKLGLLMQPHTSAGRIPSLNGYRFYVSHLLQAGALQKADKNSLDDVFENLSYDTEKMLQGAAAGISELTGYPAVVTSPKRPDLGIAHFDVLQVGRSAAAIVAVSQAGGVFVRVAKARRSLLASDIELLSALLNTELTFLSSKDFTRERVLRMARMLDAKARDLFSVVSAASRILSELGVARVYVARQEYLLDYPELDSSLRGIVSLFGDERLLESLLTAPGAGEKCIWGDEIPGYYLPGLCLLSAKYSAGSGLSGAVALAGPARMDYIKLFPMLKYFTEKLGHIVTVGGKEE